MRYLLLLATLFMGGCTNLPMQNYRTVAPMNMNDLPSHSSAIVILERYDIPNSNVWVKQKHKIDSMGPYSDGTYEYYYEYDMYYFSGEIFSVKARSYVDSSEEASFTALEVNGESRFLEIDDFKLPFMKTVIEYLKSEGKTKLEWLDTSNPNNGYSVVPATI